MFLLRAKLILQGEKRGNIDQKLEINNVARQVWRKFLRIPYFARDVLEDTGKQTGSYDSLIAFHCAWFDLHIKKKMEQPGTR